MKKNYRDDIQELYASSYLERNLVPQFISEYREMLSHMPYAIGYMVEFSDFYYKIKNFDKAIDYLDKASELGPFFGSIYAKKARIYADMEKDSEALKYYKKAIVYDPTDFTSRDKIGEILKEDSPFEAFEEKDYHEIFKNAPDAEDFPEDNSMILTEEKQIVIHEKGAVEEKRFLLVKVFDKSGVDLWKEYGIPANSSQYYIIEKAEVFKADGSKNVAEVSGQYCVFTNLEPGDGIFITYKLQNYYQGVLSDHFWGKQYFEYYVPAQNIEFSICYDEDEIPLKFQVANGDIQSEKKTVNGKTVLKYWAEDVPSVKEESYMPVLSDIGTVLHYSTMENWKFVSDWYTDLSTTKAKADYDVIQQVNSLFPNGWEDLSQDEIINTIYTYIVNEIRYSSISFRQSGLIPQKASKVINTKIGDCKDVSTLFVVMCEVVGIDADLVLVNTREKGRTSMILPSIDFNHCIAKVDIDGEENFVELTTDNYAFGTISPYLEQSFILEIDSSKKDVKTRLLPKNDNKPNAIYRKTEVKLLENEMVISKQSIKTGSMGGSMRSSYRDLGEEAREKEMLEAISGDYAGIKLIDVGFDESLSNNSDSVHYNYSFRVNRPYSSIGGLKIVKLPITDDIKPIDFLSNSKRKYGVELWKYFRYTKAVENLYVILPEGKSIVEVPEDVLIDNALVKYKLAFRKEGNNLIVDRSIDFKKTFISIDEFELLKTTIERIATADDLQIGFK